MPYKKKPFKKSYKRPFKKKYKNKVSICRSMPLIAPDKMFVKLVDTSGTGPYLTAGASSIRQTMSGNSIYDPDSAGVGGQPTGSDQWFTFYQHVKVRGCKIVVRIVNSDSDPVEVSLTASRSITTSTYTEQAYSRECLLPGNQQAYKTLSMYMSTKKMMANIADRDFSHTSGGNPTERWYYIINMHNALGNSTVDCQLFIKTTYYCEFFERLNLADS